MLSAETYQAAMEELDTLLAAINRITKREEREKAFSAWSSLRNMLSQEHLPL